MSKRCCLFPTQAVLYKCYVDNFLLIGFTISIAIALSFPLPGAYMSAIIVGPLDIKIVQFLNNCVLFFINGLSLDVSDLKTLYHKKFYFFYGILFINFVTTLVAFIMIRLPFSTYEFAVGLAIFSIVPTTLGVGVSLTTASKGDIPLALMLTVFSNILGAFMVPYLLELYLSSDFAVGFNPAKLLLQLVLCILIPIIAGISIRASSKNVGLFVKRHKTALSMFANCNLFMIIWMAMSSSCEVLLSQNGLTILYLVITTVVQHVSYLLMNYTLTVHVFGFPIESAIVVTIMASQKSCPVALAVISNVPSSSATIGLYAVPCLIGQVVQIFIGSFIAPRFASMIDNKTNMDLSNSGTDDTSNNYVDINNRTVQPSNPHIVDMDVHESGIA